MSEANFDWLVMALQFHLPLSSITAICALDLKGPMKKRELRDLLLLSEGPAVDPSELLERKGYVKAFSEDPKMVMLTANGVAVARKLFPRQKPQRQQSTKKDDGEKSQKMEHQGAGDGHSLEEADAARSGDL